MGGQARSPVVLGQLGVVGKDKGCRTAGIRVLGMGLRFEETGSLIRPSTLDPKSPKFLNLKFQALTYIERH